MTKQDFLKKWGYQHIPIKEGLRNFDLRIKLEKDLDEYCKEVWENACDSILTDFSNDFIKMGCNEPITSHSDVFRTIGETITNYPKPEYIPSKISRRNIRH